MSNVSFRFPTSLKKDRRHQSNRKNQPPGGNQSRPQKSYVGVLDDAFSDEASENYNLYVSGTFDLDLAAHSSLLSHDSFPPEEEQNLGFLDHLLRQEEYEDEKAHFLDYIFLNSSDGHENVPASHQFRTTVEQSDGYDVFIVKEPTSYLIPVSVARGMNSILSFSSEEDALFEFTTTNDKCSPTCSSSFEDLYTAEQEDHQIGTSDSSDCSESTYSDGELRSLTAANKDSSSTHVLPKHRDSFNNKMPDDSRDEEAAESDDVLNLCEEPRISPLRTNPDSPQFPLMLYALTSSPCHHQGVEGVFDEEDNKRSLEVKMGKHSNQSQSMNNPKNRSKRIRFQLKKLMRGKIKHSCSHRHNELSPSYMPLLLENTLASSFNFQSHELVISPSADSEQLKQAFLHSHVVDEQASSSQSIQINSNHDTTSDGVPLTTIKHFFDDESRSHPALPCSLTSEKEKKKEHGSSITLDVVNVSSTMVVADPNNEEVCEGGGENVNNGALLRHHTNDDLAPSPTSATDDHQHQEDSYRVEEQEVNNVVNDELPSPNTKSPSTSTFLEGNVQAVQTVQELVEDDNRVSARGCTIRHNDASATMQDHKTAKEKCICLQTRTKSVSTQTSPRKNGSFQSNFNLPTVGQLVPSGNSSPSRVFNNDATSILLGTDKCKIVDETIMSTNDRDGKDDGRTRTSSGVPTPAGSSKSNYKELSHCDKRQNRKIGSMNQTVSLSIHDDDDKMKSTKEESKALKFWAMAQRRAKTGSDVHVH